MLGEVVGKAMYTPLDDGQPNQRGGERCRESTTRLCRLAASLYLSLWIQCTPTASCSVIPTCGGTNVAQ